MLAGYGPASWPFLLLMAGLTIIFTTACVVFGDAAEYTFLKKDPSQVVADETAGQALALLFLPAGAGANPALGVFWLGMAFVTFRVMDILKPWPARGLQRVAGGWGIVIDDLIAGCYAGLILLAGSIVAG